MTPIKDCAFKLQLEIPNPIICPKCHATYCEVCDKVCPNHTQSPSPEKPPTLKSLMEEFDEKFIDKEGDFPYSPENLKSFITKAFKAGQQFKEKDCSDALKQMNEAYSEAKKEFELSAPMGLSQWQKHGRKFGYWEYFKKEARKEGAEEMSKRINVDLLD